MMMMLKSHRDVQNDVEHAFPAFGDSAMPPVQSAEYS